MLRNFFGYFVGVILHPSRTIEEILSDDRMLRYGLFSYLIYSVYYTVFVTYGYLILDQAGFQYQTYYPNYPSPYYWEIFMVPLLFLVQWLTLALVAYGGARFLNGKGTFLHTFAVLGLALFVPQLVTYAVVDTPNALLMPQSILEFAKAGDYAKNVSVFGPPGSLLRQVADSYLYIALLWALVVSAMAVAKAQKISFWKALPFVVLGMVWIAPIIVLTKNYVVLLW